MAVLLISMMILIWGKEIIKKIIVNWNLHIWYNKVKKRGVYTSLNMKSTAVKWKIRASMFYVKIIWSKVDLVCNFSWYIHKEIARNGDDIDGLWWWCCGGDDDEEEEERIMMFSVMMLNIIITIKMTMPEEYNSLLTKSNRQYCTKSYTCKSI